MSQPWDHLTRAGQLRRARRLAVAALEHYDLPAAQLTFLRAGDNLLYQAVTTDGSRFLLRLQDPARRNAAELRSELHWLTALRHDGGLVVPEPIPTRDGAPFATVMADGVPGLRYSVLLRWVAGQRRVAGLMPADAGRMGMCPARLHHFARRWTAPAGFARPRWDPERWIGASSPLWSHGAQVYTAGNLAVFATVARRIRAELRTLDEAPETFGLIHADLAPTNVVFQDGAAHAIDFEECGWGYYQFDVAVALTALADYCAPSGRLQDAFLNGYRSVGPESEPGAAFRDTFMAIVRIKIVAWTLTWDDPAARPRSPDYLARSVEWLRPYAEGIGTESNGP